MAYIFILISTLSGRFGLEGLTEEGRKDIWFSAREKPAVIMLFIFKKLTDYQNVYGANFQNKMERTVT